MENENNILSEALKDVKLIRENVKKRFLKENETKIDEMVSKFLENDDVEIKVDDNAGDDTTSTDKVEDAPKVEKNIEYINNLLDGIDIPEILKTSDVELEVIDTEGEPTTITKDGDTIIGGDQNATTDVPTEEVPAEEVDDNELDEFYNQQTNNDSNNNAQDNNMENTGNKVVADKDATQSKEEVKTTLQEVEASLSDENGANDQAAADKKASQLSEEEMKMIKEIEDMSDDELSAMLQEVEASISDENGANDQTAANNDAENFDHKEIQETVDAKGKTEVEEGISRSQQTDKVVGSKSFPEVSGRPERRSNMSEEAEKEVKISKKDFDQLNEAVSKLVKENKELKEINKQSVEGLESLKTKLYEATVVSHKTAYVNKLILENANNQKDKQKILKEFASVDTIDQAKAAYNKLSTEMGKTLIRESIVESITKTTISGEASKVNETKLLNENYTPEIAKMRALINFDSKKGVKK